MKKNKYVDAYKNLLKSYLVIGILSIFLTIAVMQSINSLISGDGQLLMNNVISIALGIFTSLLFEAIMSVVKDSKAYVDDINRKNMLLRAEINNLKLIINMIKFNINSKYDELFILDLYRDIQLSRNLLIDNDLLDNVSLIGITTLFDNLTSDLLNISNKKQFISNSKELFLIINNIIKMLEEVILLNDQNKQAFFKEKERLDRIFANKKKVK